MRQVVRDLVAPELKAHATKLEGLQKTVDLQDESQTKTADIRHDSVMKALDSLRSEMRSEFAALRAGNELEVLRQVAPISERIAIVETRTKKG